MRLTLEQFAALTGIRVKKPKTQNIVIAGGGYRSRWQGKETIGGKTCNFRSLWEHNYACYLEFLKGKGDIYDWEFEPKTFEFPMIYKTTPFGYLPDFKVYSSASQYEWHEVKGWMDAKSRKKLRRFKRHYPNEPEPIIIGKEWFKDYGAKLAAFIPGWKKLKRI